MEDAEQAAKVAYWAIGSIGWCFIVALCIKMLRS